MFCFFMGIENYVLRIWLFPIQLRINFIWWSDDLLKLPHEVAEETTKARGEGPTVSPEPELVEEVIKTVRDADR